MSLDMVESGADVRRHELFADLAEQVARRIIEKHKLGDDIGIDVGNDIADFVGEHWKGQNIYINADSQFKLTKRDIEIFNRFGRGNAQELAREFGISYVRVYQIYKRCLTAARKRNQPTLFADPGEQPETDLSTTKKPAQKAK